MHPIERLRYVARASGGEQSLIVRETASALASFAGDPVGLVTACRRIVARQPASGPLVWLCARILSAADPPSETWAAADDYESDPTARELAHALPGGTVVVIGWPELSGDALARRGDCRVLAVDAAGEGLSFVDRLTRAGTDACDVAVEGTAAAVADADLVLLDALAAGPDAFLAPSGSRAAAAVARSCGVDVWLVAGVGRLLPASMWQALLERIEAGGSEPWDRSEEVVPLGLIDRICGPVGPEEPAVGLRRVDCPVVPELLRRDLVL